MVGACAWQDGIRNESDFLEVKINQVAARPLAVLSTTRIN